MRFSLSFVSFVWIFPCFKVFPWNTNQLNIHHLASEKKSADVVRNPMQMRPELTWDVEMLLSAFLCCRMRYPKGSPCSSSLENGQLSTSFPGNAEQPARRFQTCRTAYHSEAMLCNTQYRIFAHITPPKNEKI